MSKKRSNVAEAAPFDSGLPAIMFAGEAAFVKGCSPSERLHVEYRGTHAAHAGGTRSQFAIGSDGFARVSRSRDRRTRGYRVVKRGFDIAFSMVFVALCVILLPITVLVLAITAISSKAFPVYSQERIGQYGRSFSIYKLRTMVSDADNVEKYLDAEQMAQWKSERKVDGDPRITRWGAVMRRMSLDELPQFINVLKGDMSVIGPRPITREELSWFGDDASLLLSCPCGITGEWQVGVRTDASFESGERQKLELSYCACPSIGRDVRIFFKTFSVMFYKPSGR